MAFLTMKEAAELESVTSEAIRLKLTANRYPLTRLADTIAKNGKRPTLIHIDSLSINAQIKFYRAKDQQTSTPNGTLTTATEKGKETALLRLKAVKEAENIKEHHIVRGRGKKGIVGSLTTLANKHNITYQTLNRLMRRFRSGGFAALLPRGAATPRKSRFDGEISEAIQSEWLSLKRPSQTDVFEAVQTYCIENLIQPPSYKTVQRIIETIPASVARLHRMGISDWKSKSSPKAQRDMSLIAVNDWWNSDHREFDLFIDTGKKVQRPWLTSWFDMSSRKITGYTVSFAPNSQTIALSFRTSVKTHGRPKNVYIDNGKDYVCHYLNGKTGASKKNRKQEVENEGVFALLGCEVTNAIPYAAWSKPIERWHDNIRRFERTLPGWCGSDNKDRPEKLQGEISGGKLLTLEEFSGLFSRWIDEYNNRVHSALEGKTPAEMYEGVSKEIPSDRALDLLLMKEQKRKVHPHGVLVFPKRYHYAPELGPYIGNWVTVRYDPEVAGKVYVFLDGGRKFLCTAIQRKLLSMKASEADLKAEGKQKSEALKLGRAFKEDLHKINHGDTRLAAITAAKQNKGYLAVTTSDEGSALSESKGKILRFVSKLDAAAKQIEEAERQNPTPEFTPEPTADNLLASDDYIETMQRQLKENQARVEADRARDEAEILAMYQH